MMLYPTRAEATIGFDKVFVALKDPKIGVRKSDMIETADVKIHFMSICPNYYGWLKGYTFDEVWIDSRIKLEEPVEKFSTLEQFIYSRKR